MSRDLLDPEIEAIFDALETAHGAV